MKIIFMGTPDFALSSLRQLLLSLHEVVAVFTQAPKPKGRGMQVTESPVHILAKAHNIPVYTPASLRTTEVQAQIDMIEADIIVVVAYGFIVPEHVLKSKRYGCLNIHPSMLPRFRGAAPLQRTIIAGDTETAVCIMQMNEGLDTGDIILREDFAIKPDITLQELHDVCANKGAILLLQALNNLASLLKIPQALEGVTYAHKLTKEEGLINWNMSAIDIERKIRGMTPWPGVFFEYAGQKIKVLRAKMHNVTYAEKPGMIRDNIVVCGSKALRIELVQKPGKGPVSFEEFSRDIVDGSMSDARIEDTTTLVSHVDIRKSTNTMS